MVDEVFQRAFIPKRLDEVHAFERDRARLAKAAEEGGGNGEDGASGEVEGVYYQSITGMRRDLSGVETTPKILRAREEANKRSSGWAGVAVTTSAEARRREARGGSDAVEPESSKASIDATERAISSKGGAGGGDGPSGVVPDSGDGDGRSDGSDDSSDDSSDGDDAASEVDSEGNPIEGTRRRFPKKPPVDKAAVKAARKANKAEVKAEAAERRKTKIKKHVKKKAVGKNKKR
jgi:RIO kinase 1